MLYKMVIRHNKKVVYELEVEANSVEHAREIIWDFFIYEAEADIDYRQEGEDYNDL